MSNNNLLDPNQNQQSNIAVNGRNKFFEQDINLLREREGWNNDPKKFLIWIGQTVYNQQMSYNDKRI